MATAITDTEGRDSIECYAVRLRPTDGRPYSFAIGGEAWSVFRKWSDAVAFAEELRRHLNAPTKAVVCRVTLTIEMR